MLMVYLSLTGQTRRFIKKFDWPAIELFADTPMLEVTEPYIIVAPTYEREVTDLLWEFVETGNNRHYLQGVAGGGNVNFNTLYCFTAKDLSRDFNVPILHLFEFQGNANDVKKLKEEVEKLGKTKTSD
ncbi:class Ib ribonucleoside-diphosphate reductase assembly flavoprotein NrdI [Tuanshanicoccus lijuaniae]|uniref:class Ib ribonucleoside-diphosphate reductase assembly flavoprotein NrdI n=1 Tax=Aerococcaceae bacterium zg-1292 TaxID=2774330 RepID=UPI001936B64B|nr:class Ib ribonucleoside-diphosphate reductase assembly flavoprotein NrdI [Aerococcaceae bacterium zg-1292]MBF6626867.1 class Ib ribonucleoside-diphosphate reductase assembly flavoprotein NrdI [Aerococcaceae bacterium zg-BR9]MBF6979302.1 class Ib ribonucleoside-diphosphate reductase assembly flavoprotein NrdI [Aerococcaceae bacterium zg-BR22]MBS4455447.1 class Ib ribonucleoside-diphosphate reductase assembly flavoprotein NrdI [Aerococcaceae bacterium zg-A91]MBS4457407.1 class Ib ribonucleosid